MKKVKTDNDNDMIIGFFFDKSDKDVCQTHLITENFRKLSECLGANYEKKVNAHEFATHFSASSKAIMMLTSELIKNSLMLVADIELDEESQLELNSMIIKYLHRKILDKLMSFIPEKERSLFEFEEMKIKFENELNKNHGIKH